MREHVFGEIDKNKDRVISFAEFVQATEQKEFNQNDEWKVNETKKFTLTASNTFKSNLVSLDCGG